ncbi:hypothetical protein SELMODRAFT_404014 [Selaginella moellendorffii]|uniref:DUF295 domain-containing protein n=1 Tax=Selaginella moellendorffii TaxID=88036 RepID=D8QU04_SELML|nr:hypothetical protein SELMODRAFT_404014 [Selaginella moellendorffii]
MMHVFNPFKSEAFQVAIPPKIVVSTAAIVPKASSSKEFRVVEMAEFGEVRGVYIYESRRKVLELEPLQYLEFYPCNVIVGNMFCFLAKRWCGRVRRKHSHCGAQSVSVTYARLWWIPLILDEYSEVVIWQMDEHTLKWETVAKMPDDLCKLHFACDMHSRLKVCGAGEFVFNSDRPEHPIPTFECSLFRLEPAGCFPFSSFLFSAKSFFESVALELLITHDLRDCMLLDHKI